MRSTSSGSIGVAITTGITEARSCPMALYDGPVFSIERRDGRDVVVHGPAVAIVAVGSDDHLTLVRQRRVPAGGPLLELPAGGIDEGESPLDAARRELAEE